MNLEKVKSIFIKIWKNKFRIIEGIYYNHIIFHINKLHWAKRLVDQRRLICSGCKHYDQYGTSKRVIITGKPACSLCGCNIKEKTACLSCNCSLIDNGKIPLWSSISIKNDYLIEEKLDNG